MTFKSALEIDCGLRFMYDSLCIMSSCGRKMLLDSNMMTTRIDIDNYYSRLRNIHHQEYSKITHELMYLKDIHNTLSRLNDGVTLDDIELFEVKHLALLSMRIKKLIDEKGITAIELPVLNKVVETLDPDGDNIDTFYLSDVQPANAFLPNVCKLLGIVIFSRLLQPEKAASPIDVTLLGMTISFSA